MKIWMLIALVAMTGCAPAPTATPVVADAAKPVDWSQYTPAEPAPAQTDDGIDQANATLKRREDNRQFAKDVAKEQAEAEAEIRDQRRGR